MQTPSLVSSENPSLEDNLETHGSSHPQLHPPSSNLPLGVYQVPQVAVVGAEVEESIPGIYDGVRE